MTDVPDELVCVGVIARARGVSGEVEVKPLGANAARLTAGLTVFLEKDEGAGPRPFRVTGLRKLNDRLGLTLDGVTTPEAAKRLAGKIRHGVIRLADHPKSGRVVPEFPERDYREIIITPYRIVYKIIDHLYISSCVFVFMS